jgi:alpha-ketoglutaric semialdehyde dehydrogenase
MTTAIPHRLNLVGGKWRDSAESIAVLDPSDERQQVGTVPAMSADDIAATYSAASEGYEIWRSTSSVTRGRIMLRAASAIRERADELARLLTHEMGKTIAESSVEVAKAADFFEYYGGLGRDAPGQLLAHERPDVTAYAVKEPVGVVLAITPWNDPLLTPARKLAPALIAGNAAILKPASYTPLIALALGEVLHDCGFPAGVVNTVTGSGSTIGSTLLTDPRLNAVSFTGSNEVGAELAKTLAGSGVRLLAELGGKNAAVVLADADLDRAADTISAAAFAQAGQRCTATSRVIADRAIAPALLERLAVRASAHVLGPGVDLTTTMGPLVAGSQRDGVLALVDRAISAGATVVHGGSAASVDGYSHGCFVRPTILTDVSAESEIWTEEVFGPVVAVAEANDLSDALSLLNESRYALAAAVYTNDAAAVQTFIREAAVGQVAVNLPTSGWDVHMPFGGWKASGSGHKEQGHEGLDFYQQTKTVAIAT